MKWKDEHHDDDDDDDDDDDETVEKFWEVSAISRELKNWSLEAQPINRPNPSLIMTWKAEATCMFSRTLLSLYVTANGLMVLVWNKLFLAWRWKHLRKAEGSRTFSYPGNQTIRILEIDGLSQEFQRNFWRWMWNFLSPTPQCPHLNASNLRFHHVRPGLPGCSTSWIAHEIRT